MAFGRSVTVCDWKRLAALVVMACGLALWCGPALAAEEMDKAMAAYARRDYRTAARLLDGLARKGDPEAQFRLGVLYVRGQGVTKNFGRAVGWFKRAAAKGHVRAMVNLGTLYAGGRGVKKSEAVAYQWFRRAALKGDTLGMVKLGTMYANGDGVKRNDVYAYLWFALAAAKGFRQADDLKDQVSRRMSVAQRSQAERLVKKRLAEEHDRRTLPGLIRRR
jgi:TPR repeat protein